MNDKRIQHAEEFDIKMFEYMRMEYPYVQPSHQRHSDSNKDKILVLSDLHEPYSNNDVLKLALANEHDADTVFIGGDLGDYYSKSRFRKDTNVDFRDELRAVFCRMEWLSQHWNNVEIMIGNHDTRPQDRIKELCSDHPELIIMTEQNLIQYFSTFFDNVRVVGHQLNHGSKLNLTHIYQKGDIIFTHGKVSMKHESALLAKISEHLHQWKQVYDLKPYKFIAQSHNHRDFKGRVGDEAWFLLPTASNPYGLGLQYIFNANMWGKPPQCGYSVFYQKDGITDYNNSRNVII